MCAHPSPPFPSPGLHKTRSDEWIEDENLPQGWMDGLKMKIFLKVGWMDWRWKSSSRLDGHFKNVQHFISRWKIHWEIHQDIYQIRWLDGQFKNVQHFISRWIIHHDIVGTVFWDTLYIVCPSCDAGHIWLFVKTFSETLLCIKLSSSVSMISMHTRVGTTVL